MSETIHDISKLLKERITKPYTMEELCVIYTDGDYSAEMMLQHCMMQLAAAVAQRDEAQRCLGESMGFYGLSTIHGSLMWRRWEKARDAR